MKKVLYILVASLILASCSNTDKSDNSSDSNKAPASEQPSTGSETAGAEQLEQGLKGDTEEVTYDNIATGEVPAHKKINFTGTIFSVQEGRYGLKQDVEDSSESVFWIDDIRIGERKELPEGTTVTVYGSYTDKDDKGTPIMKAVFIDPK